MDLKQTLHDHLNRWGKGFEKNLTWLHDKCSIKTIKAKCDKLTAKSNPKWEKTQSNLIKIRKETRLFTLSTHLQYSKESTGRSCKRKEN